MVDPWVLASQIWVNSTYSTVPGFVPAPTSGKTGWDTMFALTRALQHELGIASLSDTFGPTTMSYLTSQHGAIDAGTSNTNVIAIMQCALWCKGYWGGTTFGTFDPDVAAGLAEMKGDMGLAATASLPPKAFKSALTMDAYVVVNGGSSSVRAIQRWLNGQYFSRLDYQIVPCDGWFSRNVQQGLMLALQYELDMDDGVANGSFGPGTQAGLRSHGNFGLGATDNATAFVRLFQAALTFNGYAPGFNGTFGASTQSETLDFQQFAELPASGSANFATWASLLVSTGDATRPGSAADTSTPLNSSSAAAIRGAGFGTIGRYLTGIEKRIMPGELDTIFASGMDVFIIHQEYNNSADEFYDGAGYEQGINAVRRARQLGIRANTIIYFAVDYDATGEEIDALLVPFFDEVNNAVATSKLVPYRVGIYGTRNVCATVSATGLAISSFVSGMSTGYSGNLGFSLPSNWAFDQVQNLWVDVGPDEIEIDKNIRSVRAESVGPSGIMQTPQEANGVASADGFFYWVAYLELLAETRAHIATAKAVADAVLYYLQMKEASYQGIAFQVYIPLPGAPGSAEYDDVLGIFGEATSNEDGDVSEFGRAFRTEYSVPGALSAGTSHFAVACRGYLKWGVSLGPAICEVADLGGWALDLATCWGEYVEAGRPGSTSPDHLSIAQSWFGSRIGVLDDNPATNGWFSHSDLVSDIDGYLVAKRVTDGATLDQAVADVRYQSSKSESWRYQQFLSQRFGGSLSNASLAARDVFNSGNFMVNAASGYTLHGFGGLVRAPINTVGAPNAIELLAIGEAFRSILKNRSEDGYGPSS